MIWEVCSSFLRRAGTTLSSQFVTSTSRTGRKPIKTCATSKYSRGWLNTKMVLWSSHSRTNWKQWLSRCTLFKIRRTLSLLALLRLKKDLNWSSQNGCRFFAQSSWKTMLRQGSITLLRLSFSKTTQIKRQICSLAVFLQLIAKKLISYNSLIWTILKKWLTQTTDVWTSLLIKTSSSSLQFRERIKLMFHNNIKDIFLDDFSHEFK